MTVSGQSCNQEVEKAGREQADALLDGFSEEEKNQLRDIQEQFLVYQTTNRSVAENTEKEFLVKKMFHYLRPYRFLAIVSPLMMVGEVTADLLLPFLMSFIVNYGITGMELTDPVHGSQTAIAIMEFFHGAFYTRMELIVTFGILMLVITLIGGLFGVLCAYTAARAAQGMGYDLRRDAYRKVMSFSIEQTDQFTTGSLITRMTNDITMVVDFFEMLMRGFNCFPIQWRVISAGASWTLPWRKWKRLQRLLRPPSSSMGLGPDFRVILRKKAPPYLVDRSSVCPLPEHFCANRRF